MWGSLASSGPAKLVFCGATTQLLLAERQPSRAIGRRIPATEAFFADFDPTDCCGRVRRHQSQQFAPLQRPQRVGDFLIEQLVLHVVSQRPIEHVGNEQRVRNRPFFLLQAEQA